MTKRKKKNDGLIYDRNGIKIWHPVTSIYTVLVQDAGIVSVIINESKQCIEGRALPEGKTPKSYTAAGLRVAVMHGIRLVYEAANKIYDIKHIESVMDAVGIMDDHKGFISTATHKRIMKMFAALQHSARLGGDEEIDRTIKTWAKRLGEGT